MKLQSMTDFVLEVNKGNEEDIFIDYSKIINYAQFLKKPLNLGMFVPCDLEGNELTYPIYTTNHSDECYCNKCEEETRKCELQQKQYREAKERVLFKKCSTMQQGENKIVLCNDVGIWYTWTNRIVEDLLKENIELTESVIKQFM